MFSQKKIFCKKLGTASSSAVRIYCKMFFFREITMFSSKFAPFDDFFTIVINTSPALLKEALKGYTAVHCAEPVMDIYL